MTLGVQRLRVWFVVGTFLLFVSACSQRKSDLYMPHVKDSGPGKHVDVSSIPEPTPRHEPRTIAGNKSPYKILGKTYHIMTSPEGYTETGVASWYGKKFHGRKTSNGELYDMFAMTAAHKTLPIPSYVRVTNTANQKSVIVRVNDRGPFHGGRIIDLSYAAARKLGYANMGTATVKVEYIDPSTVTTQPAPQTAAPAPAIKTAHSSAGYAIPKNTYLQVGAFKDVQTATELQRRLSGMTQYPVNVSQSGGKTSWFRVRVGPLRDNFDLMQLRQAIIEAALPEPHVVYLSE